MSKDNILKDKQKQCKACFIAKELGFILNLEVNLRFLLLK